MFQESDIKFMRLALKQAKIAYQNNDVPIGAVLVDQHNKILAKSYNKMEISKNPLKHAEILCIQKALKKNKIKRLDNTTMYVTLEPCAMCTAAISLARIKKLIFAASSSKTGAVANGIKYLNSKHIIHKVKWDAGLLENEARELMKTFFSTLRSKNKVGFL